MIEKMRKVISICGYAACRHLLAMVVMLAFAVLPNVSLASNQDKVARFSTPGPDCYADGTLVVDGECYALVWSPKGSTFAGFSADGSLYAYQSDLVSMTVPRARVIGLPDEQGILPHLSQMTVQGGINEYVSSPGTALQGKPAQLELRPVQEELRLLVSVSFRDGSSRSLDLMPLPESRGEKP